MTEAVNKPIPREAPRIKRRDVAKGAAATAALSTTAAVLVPEPQRLSEPFFETELAMYDPHYEVHRTDSLSAKDIPEGTNLFFREYVSTAAFQLSPGEILTGNISNLGIPFIAENKEFFPEDVIDKVSSGNGFIATGDVFPTWDLIAGGSLDVAGISAGVFAAYKAYMDSKEFPTTSSKPISRRVAIKAGIGLGVWGASLPVGGQMAAIAGKTDNIALEKIANKINGLQSKLHPEVAHILLRDAVMAAKIAMGGRILKKHLGHKPKISYLVGYAHTGIEDFLHHPDLARAVITAYPKALLERLIEQNGGVQLFSSLQLFQVEPPSPSIPFKERLDRTQRWITVDSKLEQMLEAKFAN